MTLQDDYKIEEDTTIKVIKPAKRTNLEGCDQKHILDQPWMESMHQERKRCLKMLTTQSYETSTDFLMCNISPLPSQYHDMVAKGLKVCFRLEESEF